MNSFFILRILFLLLFIADEITEASPNKKAHAGAAHTHAHAGAAHTHAHAGVAHTHANAGAHGHKAIKKHGFVSNVKKSARKILDKPPADVESREYFKRLEEWAKEVTGNGNPSRTWNDITKDYQGPPEHVNGVSPFFEENMGKNRYNNVHLIDATRVKLSSGKYIHANRVNIHVHKNVEEHEIIATQGPKSNTIDDFWDMILDKKINAIVMVTNTREGTREKSAQYWPLNKKHPIKINDDMEIDFVGKKKLYGNIYETDLNVVENKHHHRHVKHTVTHFHWKEWPDHSAPEDLLSPIWLWDTLKDYKNIVIHCSAGIGRTGTIVAIELAQNTMRANQPLNIWKLVEQLRKERFGSVSELVQYKYIYQVLLNYAYYKNKKKIHLDKKIVNKIKALLGKK